MSHETTLLLTTHSDVDVALRHVLRGLSITCEPGARDVELIAELRHELMNAVATSGENKALAETALLELRLALVELEESEHRRDHWCALSDWFIHAAVTCERLKAASLNEAAASRVPASGRIHEQTIEEAIQRLSVCHAAAAAEETAAIESMLQEADQWRDRCRVKSIELLRATCQLEELQRTVQDLDTVRAHLTSARPRCDASCLTQWSRLAADVATQTVDAAASRAAARDVEVIARRLDYFRNGVAVQSVERAKLWEATVDSYENTIVQLNTEHSVRMSEERAAVTVLKDMLESARAEAAAARAQMALDASRIVTLETAGEAARASVADLRAQLENATDELGRTKTELLRARESLTAMEYLVKTRDRVPTDVIQTQLLNELSAERRTAMESDRVLRQVLNNLMLARHRDLDGGQYPQNSSSGSKNSPPREHIDSIRSSQSNPTHFLLRRARRILELVERDAE